MYKKIKSKMFLVLKILIMIVLFVLFLTGIMLPLIPGLLFLALFLTLLTTFHEKIDLYIEERIIKYPKIYKHYSRLRGFMHNFFK